MIFIVTGLGGETGTKIAPFIAKLTQEMKILTVGVVTKSYSFEGKKRKDNSIEEIKQLKNNTDSLIVISSWELIKKTTRDSGLKGLYETADKALYSSVKAVLDIVALIDLVDINLDDENTIMKSLTRVLIEISKVSNKRRIEETAKNTKKFSIKDLEEIEIPPYIIR